MGIWASFLDLLWPVAAKKAEPDFDARAAEWRRALRQSVDEMMAEHRAKADKTAAYEVKPTVQPEADARSQWRDWPVPQFDPNAEGKLRRITGSRGLRRGNSTKPRAVVDAAGVRHPSLRAAAKAHGLAPATLWDMLAEGRGGWRYAD